MLIDMMKDIEKKAGAAPPLEPAPGIAAVPNLGYRRERNAALPEFIFRPIDPLPRADFTVV